MIDVLSTFPNARRDGAGWAAKCPAHDDHRASLSIGTGDDGRTLLHCHAGCSLEAILGAMNLDTRALFPDKTPTKTIVATYPYHDEGGAHLYDVVRFAPKDFRQRRADGAWKMAGVRRVLFGLPELHGHAVAYLPEGERDVLALRAIGLIATTNPGGAGKWRTDYVDQLTVAGVTHIVLLPDNDEPGRKHAHEIATSCQAAGLIVKIVELPGLPAKGDVSDWLDAGHTRAELVALVKGTALYTPTPTEPRARAIVSLAALLTAVMAFVQRYVILTVHQAVVVSLWVAHCHALEAADATPYIHVSSPEPECGKTRLLEVLTPLVARPWMTAYTTKATLVRKVDRQQPTLLLDELDAALKGDVEYVEAVRGVLNSGYLRTGTYSMCVGQGANLTDKDFKTFCPKILAGIGRLPSTVASRSIPVTLKRRAKHETVAKWRERDGRAEAAPLYDQLAAWAPGAADTLRATRPAFPAGLRDRAEDVVEPLFAIADLAGDGWPERARTAALALLGTPPIDRESIGLQLLADIRHVFAAADNPEALSSKRLREDLCGLEDRPWSAWGKHEKPISGVALAALLAKFDIFPTAPIRLGTDVARSYRRPAFDDVWARYLAPVDAPSDSLHRCNPNGNGHEPAISQSLQTENVTNSKTPITPTIPGLCNDVTNRNPNHGDDTERVASVEGGPGSGRDDVWEQADARFRAGWQS